MALGNASPSLERKAEDATETETETETETDANVNMECVLRHHHRNPMPTLCSH